MDQQNKQTERYIREYIHCISIKIYGGIETNDKQKQNHAKKKNKHKLNLHTHTRISQRLHEKQLIQSNSNIHRSTQRTRMETITMKFETYHWTSYIIVTRNVLLLCFGFLVMKYGTIIYGTDALLMFSAGVIFMISLSGDWIYYKEDIEKRGSTPNTGYTNKEENK